MSSFKICKCGSLASWNSYFGGYYCNNCGLILEDSQPDGGRGGRMIKEVPCMDCDGKGFIAIYSEYSVWSERCPNCGGTGIVKVPMTNADRIRDMSNKELAAYLAEISGGTILKTYEQLGLSLSDEKSKKYLNELTAEYLKRLQQPAEEDT